MKHLSLLFVLLSACQVLPGVPSDSVVPVATTLALAEAPVDLAAGEWTRLSVQVLDQSGQAMAGQVVTAAVHRSGDHLPGHRLPALVEHLHAQARPLASG